MASKQNKTKLIIFLRGGVGKMYQFSEKEYSINQTYFLCSFGGFSLARDITGYTWLCSVSPLVLGIELGPDMCLNSLNHLLDVI